ncbi:head GIN domain-containing protein [Aquirufa aurantiipilula]
MKTKFNLFIFLGALFMSIVVFASPEDYSKKFKVSGFQNLDLGQAFEIKVSKGSAYSLAAYGRQEDVDDLEVDIDGNTLKVSYKDRNWGFNWGKNRKRVRLVITMPRLANADFSGACRVDVDGFANEEQMNFVFSGASKGQLNQINADKLNVELSGASKLNISGHAGKLNVDASGASHMEGTNLMARDTDVEASGASHVSVQSQKTLRVDASGASKVSYKGVPTISKDLSGAASINQVN